MKVGDMVTDRCDADRTLGVIIEVHAGRALVWYDLDRIIWTYHRDLRFINSEGHWIS